MTTPGWTHAEVCALAGDEVARFAEVADGVDPATPIPTCPGWSLAKLIRHTGTVHRWAAAMVSGLAAARVDPRTLALGLPDDDEGLPDWLGEGEDIILASLGPADPDAPMWAWGADQHVRFWPRRMLHETAVHRVDVELASGTPDPHVDAGVAVDGIDELLANLPASAAFSPAVAELRTSGSLGFSAEGADVHWLVSLGTGGPTRRCVDENASRAADVHVGGLPRHLLLALYRRQALDAVELTIAGDEELLAHWLEHSGLQ